MLQVRQMGAVGIITDAEPFDLPLNGVSRGVNIRFNDNKIGKAPAHRLVDTLLDSSATTVTPLESAWLFSYLYPGSSDIIGIIESSGRIFHWVNASMSEVTQVGFSGSASTIPFTQCMLAGVSYVNRSNMIPQRFLPADTDYDDLENWDTNWRCRVLRGFKDYPVALDITKTATRYPTMIKWGNAAVYGAVSTSWDHTDPTTNAGENTPGDATSAWLDGLALRNAFCLYNDTQVYSMTESLDFEVFNFRKLYDNRGIINTNCVVEVNNLHYVFDRNDIYVHDGVQHRSICDGRVRRFIFDSIDYGSKDAFFVSHNPRQKEIKFFYRSGDELVGFSNGSKCNRSAVYNYVSDTWTFYDHPNVVGSCFVGISTFTTWADMLTGWDVTGGTWYEQESSSSKHEMLLGLHDADVINASRLFGFDLIEGGVLPYPIDEDATLDGIAYRTGIDMDDSGEEIQSYKVIKAVFPQIEDFDGSGVYLKFSGTLYSAATPTWSTEQNFDPETSYKVDTREGGRYLGWYLRCTATTDFRFTGFDADIQTTGRR
jgi:hypothetical protein